MAGREATLIQTFVEVADTLVSEFDVVDVLTTLTDRCVELFGASDAGIMLVTPGEMLQVVASSSERMRTLELFEIQNEDGPCVDCYRSGQAVRSDQLRDATGRWPRFAPEAISAGITSAYALPMRLRNDVVGSLNLLRADPGPMAADDLLAAQALTDVATIALLQHRAIEDARILAEQLRSALDSRVLIEQAKGALAERTGVDVNTGFAMLRHYARNHNQQLARVARDVVEGSLATNVISGWQSRTRRR